MARITVEDCVLAVPNRFELVMLAAHRARSLSSGAELKVSRDRDKNPVVALREIAEAKVDLSGLEGALIKSLQKRIEPDQPEEEVAELLASEQQTWINDIGAAEGDDADETLEEETEDLAEESAEDLGIGSFEDATANDIKD